MLKILIIIVVFIVGYFVYLSNFKKRPPGITAVPLSITAVPIQSLTPRATRPPNVETNAGANGKAPPTNPPTRPPTNRPTNPATRPPTRPPTNRPTRPPTNRPTRPPTNRPIQGHQYHEIASDPTANQAENMNDRLVLLKNDCNFVGDIERDNSTATTTIGNNEELYNTCCPGNMQTDSDFYYYWQKNPDYLDFCNKAKDILKEKDKAEEDKALADKALADKALVDKALADKALVDKALADKALADKALVDKELAEWLTPPDGTTLGDKNNKSVTCKHIGGNSGTYNELDTEWFMNCCHEDVPYQLALNDNITAEQIRNIDNNCKEMTIGQEPNFQGRKFCSDAVINGKTIPIGSHTFTDKRSSHLKYNVAGIKLDSKENPSDTFNSFCDRINENRRKCNTGNLNECPPHSTCTGLKAFGSKNNFSCIRQYMNDHNCCKNPDIPACTQNGFGCSMPKLLMNKICRSLNLGSERAYNNKC